MDYNCTLHCGPYQWLAKPVVTGIKGVHGSWVQSLHLNGIVPYCNMSLLCDIVTTELSHESHQNNTHTSTWFSDSYLSSPGSIIPSCDNSTK